MTKIIAVIKQKVFELFVGIVVWLVIVGLMIAIAVGMMSQNTLISSITYWASLTPAIMGVIIAIWVRLKESENLKSKKNNLISWASALLLLLAVILTVLSVILATI